MNTCEIEQIARSILDRPRSASTIAQYERLYARLDGRHWLAYVVCHDSSRSTAYQAKAAYQYGTARKILSLLEVAASASLRRDHTGADIAHDKAAALATELADADYDHINRLNPHHAAAYRAPCRKPKGKGSKRHTVRPLPEDWRERLRQAAAGRDRLAVAVLATTGARPAELAMGIDVEADEESVRVSIPGAKTGQGHGQEWRRFRLYGRLANLLANEVLHEDVNAATVTISGSSQEAFRKRFGTAVKRAGLPAKVTAYTCRHAFAAALKASGTPIDELAKALGHAVNRTQSLYGHAYQSDRRGGRVIDSVESAQTVRDTASMPPGSAPAQSYRLN